MKNERLQRALDYAKHKGRVQLIRSRAVPDSETGSHIYFIRCQQFVKIGIADSVAKRLCSIQTGNPYTLELLNSFSVTQARQVEHSLHEHFDAQWQRGEWFTLTDEQIERIRTAQTIVDVL